MIQLKQKIREYIQKAIQFVRNYGTLCVAFCAVVAVLVYFLPRESKFGYEYEQGRPWRYNSLIATFDFPIYKTQQEVEAERDSALRQFQPFYMIDEGAAERSINDFKNDFLMGKYEGVPAACLPHIERLLQTVYDAGIVNSDELAQMAQDRTTALRVVEGTEAISHPLSELYSTRSAYEYIMHADTVHYPRELLARCNVNEYLEPNLKVDSAKTRAAREDALASVSPASGMVQSGQRIIDRGEIISPQQYQILQSYERENMRRNDPSEGVWQVVLGQVIFVAGVLTCFTAYLLLFKKKELASPHSVLLLATLVAFFPLITYLMVDHKLFNVYIVPYAMVPIFVLIFMDSHTAFITMVTSVLLSSFALRSNYEFILVQLVAGMTAIYTLKDLTQRSQLISVTLKVFIASVLIMLGYDLAQGTDLMHLNRSMYVYIAVGGVLLLFAYPLLYLIEKAFGFTSSVTLIELSNINNPLLRKMSKIAQGTFAHSLQVANLAAEVADKIGAKVQLVRTGALYHDIGKIEHPTYFTENQTGENPLDNFTEEESARLIINHVTDGLKLANKYDLPKRIKEFISTHHGRSKVKYFYIQWKNKHPGEEPDPKLFTYPGPNPFKREHAILMMCDAVEASSRSLKEFTEENIKALVDRIVDGQVEAGYFKNCPITFRDINLAKEVLVESLKTIYHTRISYPELNPEPAKPASQHEPRYPHFFRRNTSR